VIPDKKIESFCQLETLCLQWYRPAVDEQNQFISDLTGNNMITMPKKELLLQDITTPVTKYILVAWILKNMHNKKIHLESTQRLFIFLSGITNERAC